MQDRITSVAHAQPTTSSEPEASAEDGFIAFPRQIFNSPEFRELAAEAQMLLLAEWSHVNTDSGDTEVWAGNNRLSHQIGCEGTRTVERYLPQLERSGFIEYRPGVRNVDKRNRPKLSGWLLLPPSCRGPEFRQHRETAEIGGNLDDQKSVTTGGNLAKNQKTATEPPENRQTDESPKDLERIEPETARAQKQQQYSSGSLPVTRHATARPREGNEQSVVALLRDAGVGGTQAVRLADAHTESDIRAAIAHLRIVQFKIVIDNPAGWLVRCLDDGYEPLPKTAHDAKDKWRMTERITNLQATPEGREFVGRVKACMNAISVTQFTECAVEVIQIADEEMKEFYLRNPTSSNWFLCEKVFAAYERQKMAQSESQSVPRVSLAVETILTANDTTKRKLNDVELSLERKAMLKAEEARRKAETAAYQMQERQIYLAQKAKLPEPASLNGHTTRTHFAEQSTERENRVRDERSATKEEKPPNNPLALSRVPESLQATPEPSLERLRELKAQREAQTRTYCAPTPRG